MEKVKNAFSLDVVSVRLVKDVPLLSDKPIAEPQDAIKVVGNVLSELDREAVCIINLRADSSPINCHIASIGSINAALIAPRELLKASILSNACRIIMVHNHTADNLKPSRHDIEMTDRMARICEMINIPLLDHVIVGGDNSSFFSFREKGVVDFDKSTRYADDISRINLAKVAEGGMTDGKAVHGRGAFDCKKR